MNHALGMLKLYNLMNGNEQYSYFLKKVIKPLIQINHKLWQFILIHN